MKKMQIQNLDPTTFMSKIMTFFAGVLIMTFAHILGSFLSNSIQRVALEGENRNKNENENDVLKTKTERTQSATIRTTSRATYYIIVIIGFIIVLHLFGIEIASIIAIIGTVGFILGMALQGTLSDIASGVLLAFFQTYQIGDIVKTESIEGIVKDFRLVNTVLLDLNNHVTVSIPNSKMQNSMVHNYTLHPFIIASFQLQIANGFKDIEGLKRKIEEFVSHFPEVVKDTEFGVRANVSGMENWGSQIIVRVPIAVSIDLVNVRGNIFSGLRSLLAKEDIPMLDIGSTRPERDLESKEKEKKSRVFGCNNWTSGGTLS